MGNIVQCCNILSNHFKCQDTPAQGEAERSPLLSSDESECESPSLQDEMDDDLLTVSTGVSNSVLEPEHFLYPDIVLSSNLGGDVTLVEPMVCLLVSEEDEGGGEGHERSHIGRSRSYSEVETQTEVETRMGNGVQTQTEVQVEVEVQTEILVDHNEIMARDINLLTSTGIHNQVDMVSGTQTDDQNTQERSLDFEKKEGDYEAFAELDLQVKTGKQTEKDAEPKELTESHTSEKSSNTSTKNTCPTEQTDELMREAEGKTVLTSVMQTEHYLNKIEENIDAAESQKNVQPTKPSIIAPEDVENFDSADTYFHSTYTRNQDNEEINAGTQSFGDMKGALHQLEDEEGAEMKKMAMSSVDRLFQAATHVKAPQSQIKEIPEDDQADKFDDEERKQLSIHDFVNLQESSFTVRIQSPGTESFDLQVSSRMLVAELHQVLMDHELTCHRTCFSLQLGGSVLDSLTELGSIQAVQEGVLIKVVEDSYSVRDARLHIRHVRDLLRSLDPADAYNGVNGASLSYLTFFTRGDMGDEFVGSRQISENESVDYRPQDYLLPGCKDRPLTPLQPLRDDRKPIQCLRVLSMSSWNPPPGNRRMHGDLMYLNVLTMENKELNITSSTRGFYLNQSTAFKFNPKPALPIILCHSLVELLSQLSPTFKKNFIGLQRKRVHQHPYERIAAPFQVFTWIARHRDHNLDCVRAEETHTSCMGQDEQTAGQSRDWNEELQGCRELTRNSLEQRLHRERCMFKTNCDFVAASTKGAVAVIDGNVMPLNPGEAPQMQMFIWNNLFFSLGFDISDHYRPLGGNTAAHAAALCDLRGAQAYLSVDVEGLHTLGTAVVDYRGIRVIAQTIVPGILEKNQEQSVVYGSNDYGKTVFTDSRFLDLLDETCKPLRIRRHQVLDHNNCPLELCSGIETKGIMGNDGRSYILDLLRTFPPDLNFQFSEMKEREKVPKKCASFGYPKVHHHSLASLRPELVEAFIQHRYEAYTKMVSEGQEEQSTEQLKEFDCEPRTEDTTPADVEIERREMIMRACKAVGSVSDSGFDILFNPDVCSPGVRFPPECAEEVQRQRQLLWDAAAFLLSNHIPVVLRDCLQHLAVPMDGATMSSVLHHRGVNIRYLGTLLRELRKMEEKERLSHIQRICVSEIIIRSAKHIFRAYLQDVEPAAFSAAVSHFLNCLLTSSSCFTDSCSDELLSRRRNRRRRSHGNRVAMLADSVWARLSPSELWGRVKTEAESYYHYTIEGNSIDKVIENYGLQKISMLREIAVKTGIQVQLVDYVFESRHRPVFREEDVVNMFPVVKHLKHTATDATKLMKQAEKAIQQGYLKVGYELVSQALTLFSSVCGVLHEDVCICLRLLGRISYILGEYADALSHQEKAVLSSERVQGIDHPQTIQDYTHLALYCFAGGRLQTSIQLLYRARYLTLVVTGEDHPHVALVDTMLGLVLYGMKEYELSLKYLQNALALTSKYHGSTSLKHAQSHHTLATVYESKGEFRSALQHEKEAFLIYKSQVGEDHETTKESSEYLKSLTQQAVVLQKAMNQIFSNTPSACVHPPKFSTPSLPTILQQLNLACGIILITIRGNFQPDG